MRAKIIAVDFDGTLIEEGKWPNIGATNESVLNNCKDEQAKGARIILWTNRVGEPLETAIKWCEEHGLRLDAVNDNHPESVQFFGANPRKIYADEYIDDRMAKGFSLPYHGSSKGSPESSLKVCQFIDDIRNLLIDSDAVDCTVESYEPELYASKASFSIPAGYHVVVDFNKLAKAVYDAGYRKEKKHDSD